MVVAHPPRDDAGAEPCLALVGERPLQRGEQVQPQVGALPGALAAQQGGEHAGGEVLGREHVHEGDARLHRGVRFAGDAHEPARGLDDEVVAGQVPALAVAEAGDGGVDHGRVLPRDVVVAQAEALHGAGLEVVDHDVGPGGQGGGPPLVLGVLQVPADRLLVAVHGLEVGGARRRAGRGPAAGVVAALGVLHLDDARPEVRQRHGGERAGEDAGEVGDEDAVEGERGRGGGGGGRGHGGLLTVADDTTTGSTQAPCSRSVQ